MTFKNLSIRVKLLLIQVVFFIFLILFTILITNFTSNSFENEAIKNLQKEYSHIRDMIETYNESLKESTDKLENIFVDYFSDNFVIDNNRMIEVNGKKTPALLNEGILLNNNFSVVDHFYNLTGCVSTVFVRYENDFYRITTSLKKEDGTRALGTALDRNHPAYHKLLAGEEYIGKATLFNKDYMTKYKPIIQNGRVIAVLFIGLEFSEGLKALKNKIKSLKFGETGYFFIIDANVGKSYGNIIAHPTLEGKNVIDETDADNKPIFKTILEKKEGILYYN
jgi:methyl-accepting chemotaxis protein-2 (aspartate sensor receptor)